MVGTLEIMRGRDMRRVASPLLRLRSPLVRMPPPATTAVSRDEVESARQCSPRPFGEDPGASGAKV